MMPATDNLEKKYYKIKDVAEMLDVAPSALRFWESQFPDIKPMRSAHNIRYYTPKDIEKLRIIRFLVKEKGLKIEAAKEQIRVNKDNVFKRIEIIDALTEVRDQLSKLNKAINFRKI